MDDISGKIETKTAGIARIQRELEMSKREAIEARKEEQVCITKPPFDSFSVIVLRIKGYSDNMKTSAGVH